MNGSRTPPRREPRVRSAPTVAAITTGATLDPGLLEEGGGTRSKQTTRPGALKRGLSMWRIRTVVCALMVALSDSPVILIIEDRPEMMALLRRTFDGTGYRLIHATDAKRGLAAALEERPSLVILDVGLPDGCGFDVVRDLRRRAYREPVLILTGRGSIEDKVHGLEAGADDYMAKPFDTNELNARINALLRRARTGAADTTLEVGKLLVDLLAREVSYAGKPVALTQREFELLAFLARNADRVISRETISRSVWEREDTEMDNIVTVYVSYLRRKLAEAGAPEILASFPRGGYVLRSAPARRSAAQGPEGGA
jgi:DNA-binding response OmpR family regulator